MKWVLSTRSSILMNWTTSRTIVSYTRSKAPPGSHGSLFRRRRRENSSSGRSWRRSAGQRKRRYASAKSWNSDWESLKLPLGRQMTNWLVVDSISQVYLHDVQLTVLRFVQNLLLLQVVQIIICSKEAKRQLKFLKKRSNLQRRRLICWLNKLLKHNRRSCESGRKITRYLQAYAWCNCWDATQCNHKLI